MTAERLQALQQQLLELLKTQLDKVRASRLTARDVTPQRARAPPVGTGAVVACPCRVPRRVACRRG